MLTPGTALELTFPVTETLTAKTVGSGTLDVLATPVMIARMEQAAWTAVAPSLSPEEGTVGTWMNVKHLSATPIGVEVTCRAELTEVDGRRLVFRVTAQDSQGLVGEGIHERVIVQNDRFLTKAQKKRKVGIRFHIILWHLLTPAFLFPYFPWVFSLFYEKNLDFFLQINYNVVTTMNIRKQE